LERAFARSERAGKEFNRSMGRTGSKATGVTANFKGIVGAVVGVTTATQLAGKTFDAVGGAIKASFEELFAGQAVAADTAERLSRPALLLG